MDPIEQFLASMSGSVPSPEPAVRPASSEADLFAGSEPVPAAPAPVPSSPAPEVPAASAPAIVVDVLNTSAESALAELIRRVQAIEAYLRRNGASL